MDTVDSPTPRRATPSFAAARVALSGVFFGNGLGIGLWAAHIPMVKNALDLGDGELGIVLLAVALGAIMMMPVTGLLAERFGSGKAAATAALAFAVVLPLPVLAPSFASVIAAALVFGAGNGSVDVSMNAHATALERLRGKAIMSSFHAFFSLGGLIGAVFGGVMIALFPGRATGLLLSAGILIVSALIVRPFLVSIVTERSDRTSGGFSLSAGALGFGALALLCMLVEGAVADWSGVYLVSVTGVSVASAASGFAAFSLCMTAGRLVGDAIVRVLGSSIVVGAGGLLMAAGTGLAVTVPDVVAGTIGFAIIGFGAANVVPVLFAMSGRLDGVAPAIGIATTATLGYAGFLAGPPVIGFVAELFGLRSALALLGAASLVIALAGLVARKT